MCRTPYKARAMPDFLLNKNIWLKRSRVAEMFRKLFHDETFPALRAETTHASARAEAGKKNRLDSGSGRRDGFCRKTSVHARRDRSINRRNRAPALPEHEGFQHIHPFKNNERPPGRLPQLLSKVLN